MQQAGDLSLEQVLHTTTCDIEPSIIARNIVLYKLIYDEIDPAMVWSLFYGKVVDKFCLNILISCAANLHAVGTSLDEWHRTPFGEIIRFCDEQTYSIVCQIWAVYAKGKVNEAAASKMEESHNQFSAAIQKTGVIMTAATQAQPCTEHSFANRKTHSDIALAYTSRGQTPASIYSAKGGLSTNPMMYRGVDQIADLHYALDPTLGFHLALAYLRGDSDSELGQSNYKRAETIGSDKIYMTCFMQFKQWCRAFRELFILQKVKIYSFAGDMLDFCRAISKSRPSKLNFGKVVGNFSLGHIHLLPGMPLEYDVIDTSNVSDSIGLLNVLLACRGLLSQGLHSTISTDFLNLDTKSSVGRDLLLQEILGVDVSTFAAITGLSLLGSATKITTSYANYFAHNPPEIISQSAGNRTYITLEWKYVRATDVRVNLESKDFVAVYTKIFRNMYGFSMNPGDFSEGIEIYMQKLKSELKGMKLFSTPSMQTFVQLVCIGVNDLQATDRSTIPHLIQSIKNCEFGLQVNHEQDFLCWLSILGLLSPVDIFGMNERRFNAHQLTRGTVDLSFFGSSPSEMILVKVLVPKCIIKEKLDKLACPILEMSVQTMGTDDRFASFHIGYVSERLITPHARSKFNRGCTRYECENFILLEGNSSNYQYLVCSVIVPISCLIGDKAQISLSVSTATYKRGPTANEVLGPSGLVYSASLHDTTKVSWTNYIPEKVISPDVMKCNKEYLCSNCCHDLQGSIWSPLTAIVQDGHVTSFESKVDLANTNFFKDGNMGSCNPILLDNSNMLRISLQLAPGRNLKLSLPLALNVNNSTIQISRGKGYLKILLPFFKKSSCQSHVMISAEKDDVTLSDERRYSYIGSSRALLNSMPKVDLTLNFKLNHWLYLLARSQLAVDERVDNNTGMTAASISMKNTIRQMILHAFNQGHDGEECRKRIRLFSFMIKEIGCAIMVYVNSIRLNFDDGSIVIDAAVCVLTDDEMTNDEKTSNKRTVGSWCDGFGEKSTFINITDDELVLWKKALPIMNERTRNDWKHDKNCQYVSSGTDTIPLSSKICGQPVICRCGMGKGMQGSEFEKIVGKSNPVYQHFFRAAISPVFNI